MLRFLRIRNLAVIEAVEVEFEPGFNVLTGETGTGKSILVEAVGLLLGARASADLVRTGEAQATIEAIFDDPSTRSARSGEAARNDRARPGKAGARELIVRREITSQGRSRSFIDGALATAAALRDLSSRLVELHGQHEHQSLLDPLAHLPLLDDYADLTAVAADVAAAWTLVRTLREQLERSRMDAREKAARKPGEDEELASTRQVLASAERVQRLCEESYSALYDNDSAVLAGLGGVWKRVGELATIDPQFAPYVESRDGIKSQLEDLAFFLRSYADGIDASPGRLQQVEDGLSRRRRAAAATFARELEALLAELAMARTRFEVRFNDGELPPEGWGERGIDQAEFFISPNPGEDLRPLARIVSGGELSRVMLALKTLAGAGARTLIFDEVDAGIGGRVADVVGSRLQALGEEFQVLCITHLPQIAARGDAQFAIEKSVRGRRTVTRVERLDDAGRVEEVARMIGGASVTEQVRASARELLSGGSKRTRSTQARRAGRNP